MTERVAFVVQRFGREVNGGSEQHCRLVAERMTRHWRAEVLTTCALDYVTWRNHYPAGEDREGELVVRRFPVARERDLSTFDRLSAAIAAKKGHEDRQEAEIWMREQGPWSPELLEYLRSHESDYDALIFFTYLYPTTYFGLPLVADKAVLVPTAHDEWPIHLAIWDRFFELPRTFIFNTEEEAAFLRRRFPRARLAGPIVGLAVEPPHQTDPDAFRRKHRIPGRFVLYAGRIDLNKGVPELLENFLVWRAAGGGRDIDLVLVGKPMMGISSRPGVRVVGFVSEQEKWDAMAACEALIMPSAFESLSLVCLEAWSMGKPVIVNARSEVAVGQCRRSQGGLWYSSTDEFCAVLDLLGADEGLRRSLGARGRAFVAARYEWSSIVSAYRDVVSAVRA